MSRNSDFIEEPLSNSFSRATSLQDDSASRNSRARICAIPPEILSTVFECGKAMVDDILNYAMGEGAKIYPVPFEIVVSQICSHFRIVAISTPKLWTYIQIGPTSPLEYIAAYIARSGSCWLDLRLDLALQGIHIDEAGLESMLDLILPNSHRWRSLSITYSCEHADRPIVKRICHCAAPGLQQLSITVDDVDHPETGIVNNNITLPHIFQEGTPKLEFIRLRGLAMHLFRPQLNTVVTFHIDQTNSVPLHYSTFRYMLTCSASLTHLSIFGDIIFPASWPGEAEKIHLPALQSLRICGVAGEVYSGILLAVDAPKMESLTLKDLQEHDLDSFLERMNSPKYASLRHLFFCDFDLSIFTYERMVRIFRHITTFSTLHSSIAESPLVDLLLEATVDGGVEVPWPNLEILSFPFDFYGNDEEVIERVAGLRKIGRYPISKILLRIDREEGEETMESIDVDDLEVTFFSRAEIWPVNRVNFDHEDTLFL